MRSLGTRGYIRALSMAAGIILAAGKGTRMKSDLPKGLHPVCGMPMVEWIGRAMRGAGIEKPVVVIGHGADQMRETLGDRYEFALQEQQLGTGHAALMAHGELLDYEGPLVVTPGDTPLLTAEALQQLIDHHTESRALITVATFHTEDPTGYGRVVRDAKGTPLRIVEHKDASAEERKICEVNSGVFCFDARSLFLILPGLKNDNAQGEYYLTDVLARVAAFGGTASALSFPDASIFAGVNDRWQLAEVGEKLRMRLLKAHALNGVTIEDPASTYIGCDVEIGEETVIGAGVSLRGQTRVGSHCSISSYSHITDSTVGDRCEIRQSWITGAVLEAGVKVGPFAHLRPGTHLGEGTKVGNFVEVKNAQFGVGVSANHLSYIGDAEVGARTNIGAGTITCNYDGFKKHRTHIGVGAFVGSNSTLVAPVTIGDGSFIGAGSVITKNVSADSLAIGRGRQEEKEGWATRWRTKNEG